MRQEQRKPSQSFIRINHKIRVPQVRCTDEKGELIGVMPTSEALRRAHDVDLDLVELSPNADPPVCRIMDFGKYRYKQSMKRKQARKSQQHRQLKEVKYHSNVGEHDYQTKLTKVRDFLAKGHKVKLSLMFRGRENAHRELGFEIVKRVIEDCDDVAAPDSPPRLMGRSIICLLGVRSAKR